MRSSDQLTALINRAVTTLEDCGYSVCNTARTAVDARVPCCSGDGCGAWTVTGGITRAWPSTGEGKCSYIPGFVIKLTVAHCVPAATGELPDDAFAADSIDVLDCLHQVWTCDAKAVLGWWSLQWVSTDRAAHGVCAGWTVTLHAAWMLDPVAVPDPVDPDPWNATPTLTYDAGAHTINWTADYDPDGITLFTIVATNSVDDYDTATQFAWRVPVDVNELPADPLAGLFVWVYLDAFDGTTDWEQRTNSVDLTAVTPVDAAPTVFAISPEAGTSGNTGICNAGYTDGYPAPTFSYEWQNSTDAGLTWDSIGVTTADTPPLASGLYKCVVTATNSSGSLDADTNEITVT